MNNYKEKYEFLTRNIEEIKISKEQLTGEIEERKKEKNEKINNIEKLADEIMELVNKKNKILRNKEKLINLVTDALIIGLIAGVIYLGKLIYNTISPIGLITKLLTLTGLTSGGITIFAFGFAAIKIVDRNLKKKNTAKNKNKQEYLIMTKKINQKNKEYDQEKIKLSQINKELDKLENDKNNQQELLSTKKEELEQLIKEILTTTLETPSLTTISTVLEETSVDKDAKSKTRVKTLEK